MLSQPLVQPIPVQPLGLEGLFHETTIVDEHYRQAGFLRGETHLPGGHRLFGGLWQDGYPAAGLQDGVFDCIEVGDALSTKFLVELVHSETVAAHLLLIHLAVSDDNAGTAAEHRPEADAAHGKHREDHGNTEQSEDGEHAGEQRNAKVLHRHGGQISDDEVQHQLRGLQLAHLALAHEPDTQNDEQIEDDGAHHADDHVQDLQRNKVVSSVWTQKGHFIPVMGTSGGGKDDAASIFSQGWFCGILFSATKL